MTRYVTINVLHWTRNIFHTQTHEGRYSYFENEATENEYRTKPDLIVTIHLRGGLLNLKVCLNFVFVLLVEIK